MTSSQRFISLSMFTVLCVLGADSEKSAVPQNAQQGITRDQADAILNELKAIHKLLDAPAGSRAASNPSPAVQEPPVNVTLKLSGPIHALGRDDAPVTLIEYMDFQCPFCKKFDESTLVEIKKNYVDTGKVRYISRNFPIGFHENAQKAAVASECAGEQGKYWEMREILVSHADKLGASLLPGYAEKAGVNVSDFKTCMDSGRFDDAIQASAKEGSGAGIHGTPSFVIGKSSERGITGPLLVGGQPYQAFEVYIKSKL